MGFRKLKMVTLKSNKSVSLEVLKCDELLTGSNWLFSERTEYDASVLLRVAVAMAKVIYLWMPAGRRSRGHTAFGSENR